MIKKIIFSFLIFLVFLNTYCLAVTGTNNIEFSAIENYPFEDYYYIILNGSSSDDYNFVLIKKSLLEDSYFYIDYRNRLNFFNNRESNTMVYYTTYNINSGFSNISSRNVGTGSSYSTSYYLNTSSFGDFSTDGLYHLVYSDLDIYNGQTNVVFASSTVGSGNSGNTGEEDIPKMSLMMLCCIAFIFTVFYLYDFLKSCFKMRY